MTVRELIKHLKDNNIDIGLSGDELEVSYAGDELPQVFIDQIRSHKPAILNFLKQVYGQEAAPIPVAPEMDGYPISPSQRRSWIVSQLEASNIAYNMSGVYVFHGNLNRNALDAAFRNLPERYEIMRTVFLPNKEGDVRQYVKPFESETFAIQFKDFTDDEAGIHADMEKMICKPFDLRTGPLVRAFVYTLNPETALFLYVAHHIVSDSWSMNLLVQELFFLYNTHHQGLGNPLPPMKLQYKDYATWKADQLAGDALTEHRTYWLKQFEGEIPKLELPLDKPRPAIKTYRGGELRKHFDTEIFKKFKSFCTDNGGTIFMGVMAGLNALFHRYSRQEDIVIGFPIAGRDHPDLADQIGFFADTLALRTKFKGTDTFAELFNNVKQSTINAYEYQTYPFDQLVEELDVPRDMSRSVIFDVFVVMQMGEENVTNAAHNPNVKIEAVTDLAIVPYEGSERPITPFELAFNFYERGETFHAMYEYNIDLFSRETAVRIIDQLEQLMRAVSENPNVPINQIDFLTEADKRKLLEEFNVPRIGQLPAALANSMPVSVPVQEHKPVVVNRSGQLDFSLYYFGNLGNESHQYKLLMDGARYADENGFTAIWTPERHFHQFGGPYPNPSVLSAAIAAVTKNISIRAGSVVIPLQDPIRVAEDWSVIDNLSGGRVGIACASGWNYNDFILSPDNFFKRHEIMYQRIETIQRLWRGEKLSFTDGIGEQASTVIYPRAVQPQLPMWITSAGNPETFASAGKLGFGVLTNLMNIAIEDLAERIKIYKEAYRQHGHPAGQERITLLLHTYLGDDADKVYAKARGPFLDYLHHSLDLSKNTIIKSNPGAEAEEITEEDMEDMLDYAFFRYVNNSSLIGTKETCIGILHKLAAIGVTEIGCLIDFGVDYEATMEGLTYITDLKDTYNANAQPVKEETFAFSGNGHANGVGHAALAKAPAAVGVDTIVATFEEQVRQQPDAIALESGETIFSYRELNEKANRLGDYLRKKYAIQPDDLIAVRLERSEWMVIALLGVLKSGAAYVPVEADYPQERVDYMLADSKSKLVIDDSLLAAFRKEQDAYQAGDLPHVTTTNNLAYVIYTSGSTGQPKGVMVEHRSVVAFFDNFEPRFALRPGMVMGATTNYSFDISVLELLGTLCKGMRLCLLSDTDPGIILQHIAEGRIQALQLTPSRLIQLLDADDNSLNTLKRLKVLLVGGEALSESLYDKLKTLKATKVINVYGPTETTIWSTCLEINNSTALSIGRPLEQEQVYIISEENQLCSVGMPGEICIAGDGLARGYLNREELTAEKFVPNPFIPGERLYKTGDIGRWMPDGNIQFYGRRDNQVKVRGYRIELGEVENALQQYPGADQVAVNVIRTPEGENELVAYIVSKADLNTAALRAHLSALLPVYMIPGYFVSIPELPLNSSGKIDRKQLPDPQQVAIATSAVYVAPRTETEAQLIELWKQVLARDTIGIKDNFFELGGHSLKVIRLIGKVYRQFEVKLELRDLFIKATPEEQAQMIEQGGSGSIESIVPVAPQADYPLSPAQRRLWVLCQFEEASVAYNMPGVYVFEGQLNIDALQRAFLILIERHESLRTVFRFNEANEIRQVILPASATGFTITTLDLRHSPDPAKETKQWVNAMFSKVFDLAAGPLVAAGLCQTGDQQWVFAYAIHHLIGDAWSTDILIGELLYCYNACLKGEPHPLPALRIQYKDYAAWQQQQLSGALLESHKSYWLQQFAGELPLLNLPADHPRPHVKTYNGATLGRMIEADTLQALKGMVQSQGGTVFMGLLATLNVLLYRYSGQEDIIIGSPIAGRPHTDLHDQIGLYINTLALRTRFSGNDSFRQLLGNVKALTIGAYEHQVYPFDELVANLPLQRDMSRSALFDVMLLLQNNEREEQGAAAIQAEGLQIGMYGEEESPVSKFDLLFSFMETDGKLMMAIEYNTDLYERSSVERMSEQFDYLLQQLLQKPDTAVGMLSLTTPAEQARLLQEFNPAPVSLSGLTTLDRLFEAQALSTPDAQALSVGDRHFTYAELNDAANQMAHCLRTQHAIAPGNLVAVSLDRNEWLIVSLLAILKTGAAYVPVDPAYPQERIDYMIADSQSKLLINSEWIEQFKATHTQYPASNLTPLHQLTDLAYLIYTSGSTGLPKGVMIEHRNAAVFLHWCREAFMPDHFEVVFGVTSVCFDLSIFEIFFSLSTGKRLRLLDSALDLPDWLAKEKHILLNTVPSVLGTLLQGNVPLDNLSVLNLAGEPIPVHYISEVDTKRIKVRNLYGPSEDTTYSTCFTIVPDQPIYIGKPITNTAAYILNEQGQLQPIGVPGELYLAGDGLARGYWNRPELTAERFVQNPFVPGQKMYKTGDLVVWLPDGNLHFMGRRDTQVKVRGYRIELGEIEEALRRHDRIRDVAVSVFAQADGNPGIVAYIVCTAADNNDDWRTYLASRLPGYMIPLQFVVLEKLPLTPNGKVDYKQLPHPDGLALASNAVYVAPRNPTEETLVDIWQKYLPFQERIGVRDSLFDLGGHSLIAMNILSNVASEFGVRVSIVSVFENPTIENLAEQILFMLDQEARKKDKEGLVEIEL